MWRRYRIWYERRQQNNGRHWDHLILKWGLSGVCQRIPCKRSTDKILLFHADRDLSRKWNCRTGIWNHSSGRENWQRYRHWDNYRRSQNRGKRKRERRKRGRRSISAYWKIKDFKTSCSDQRSASTLDKASKWVHRWGLQRILPQCIPWLQRAIILDSSEHGLSVQFKRYPLLPEDQYRVWFHWRYH